MYQWHVVFKQYNPEAMWEALCESAGKRPTACELDKWRDAVRETAAVRPNKGPLIIAFFHRVAPHFLDEFRDHLSTIKFRRHEVRGKEGG